MLSNNVPMLVTPMVQFHAKQSDSFFKVHNDFLMITSAFLFLIFVLYFVHKRSSATNDSARNGQVLADISKRSRGTS